MGPSSRPPAGGETKPTSNLALRLVTAAVAVPVILALIFVAPAWSFYLLVLAALVVGAHELFAMTHPRDRVSQAMGVALSVGASLAVYFHHDDPRVLVTLLVAVPVLGPLLTLVRLGAIETAALRAAAMGFGPLFVALPLTLLATMRVKWPQAGPGLVLLSLGLAWLADTGGYFAGRFLGKHKLYEAVSPKKTVEGAVGGLLGSVLWALLGALGQAGDLGESLLKRSTGVKDSGALLPGHGGILDRLDAVLVTTTGVYLYALWTR